ncbi:MAG: metallophosphoesterase [Caulobacter sp.]|nr:metallophosphoesterase [Caulobacter sp.]
MQRQVAQAMGSVALERASRLVISAGDNFYPAGVTSTTDAHWRRSFEDVYTAPSLQVPWFSALGNHDYRGDVQAQIDYSRLSRRWRMPSRYFKVPGADFGARFVDLFVIDTSPMVDGGNYDELLQQLMHGHHAEHESARQLAWLDKALAASSARWKIVIGHHPVYSGGHGDSPSLVKNLAPLLEAHGVQLYINGHDHSLQHIHRGRVDYVCTGSGAEANDGLRVVEGTRHASSTPGFAAFQVNPDRLTFEFRDHNGSSVYQARRVLA